MRKIVLAFAFGTFQIVTAQDLQPVNLPPIDNNEIYAISGIEVKPEFPGGLEAFYKYISANYIMPEVKNLEGKVYAIFVIDKDGSVTDVKILRDIGHGTGEEAKRVLENSPRWNPGMQAGRNVRVQYSMPITISTK